MKNFFQKSLILLVLISGLILLAGCGSSSSSAPSPDTIKGLIQNDIDDVETGLSDVESKAASATGEMAATLANNVYALENRLKTVEGTLENDVKDGYITDEEKEDYEKTIADIKSKGDTLVADLKTKAGDAAATISEDTKAMGITSKDELDEMMEDDEKVLSNFEAGLSGATGETLTTMKSIIDERLATIDKAVDDVDNYVKSGIITEDEKDEYERGLKKLRRGFEEIDDSLASDAKDA